MKVGINATSIGDRPSGAKQRFVGIYGALFRQEPDWEFVVYEPADCDMRSWFANTHNVRFRRTPLMSVRPLQRYAVGLLFWAREFRSARFDLVEGLHLPLVPNPRGATLLTIHDVRGARAEVLPVRREFYRRILQSAVGRADHVITVSNAMRGELLREIPGASVSVIHNGIDFSAFANSAEAGYRHDSISHRLPAKFCLAVGHFEARKNHGKLLEALQQLRNNGRHIDLVIVGNDSGLKEDIRRQAQALGLGDSVHLLSGLSNQELTCVYRLSTLFVFPSLYEGFGIPLLEAMAHDCPFVLSDLPVFRELTQDHGVYFSPTEVRSMAEAIERVLCSPVEQSRLRAYGKMRVPDFDFAALARQLADLYRQVR